MRARITLRDDGGIDLAREVAFDSQAALEAGAEQIQKGIPWVFSSEGGTGPRWKGHAKATVRRHGEHPILRQTGQHLFNALMSPSAVFPSGRDKVSIGLPNNKLYRVHTLGSKKKGIPQRAMIDVSPEAEKRAVDAITGVILKGKN